MSDSLIYTLSTFNVWRQHVHIETELLLRIITFKKIKKYALEWNRVWWSPNFYNIIDEVDTIENIINPSINEWSQVNNKDKQLFIQQSAKVGESGKLRIPIISENYSILSNISDVTKGSFEIIEYKFPIINSVQQISTEMIKILNDTKYTSALTDNFIQKSKSIIEDKTIITYYKK